MAGLAYAIDRENGTVTVYASPGALAVGHEGGVCVDLDESDLITLLSDLQAGQATLAELAPDAGVGES